MNWLITILQGTNLIASVLTSTAESAARIRSLYELDGDKQVSVRKLLDEALDATDETMDAINAWRASKGLVPLDKMLQPPVNEG